MTRRKTFAIETIAVLIATGLIAVIITWPLALEFGTNILGGDGTPSDSMGYWWDVWNNHRNGLDLWGGAVQDQIGFPFGRPIVGSGNLLLLVFTGPAWIISSVASAAFTINTLALAGLALSGAAMYLLIRWLGLGRGPAAWAAVAFELAPYEMFRASAHYPLAHLEWAPLLLMAGIAWVRRPGWRAAILLALATLFGWLSNPYYGAMASIMAGVIALTGLAVFIYRRRGARYVLVSIGQGIGTLIVLVGVPVLILLRASSGATEAVTRQKVELDLYGARLWDYIIPPPGSRLGEALMGPGGIDPTRSPGGERMVFLGWLVIALAIAGVVLAVRRWSTLSSRDRAAFAVAIPVTIAMGLMSAASPTRIWGYEFAMPSSFVFDHLPYLRAYARFGAAVLAAVLVIAALGLSLIIRRRSTLWRYCWVAGAIVFTAVEMPVAFPIGSGPPILINGKAPADVPTWQWLRDNDLGAPVIETPAFSQEDTDRYYLAGQTAHGHPLANGGLNEKSPASDFTEEFGNPRSPAAANAYATAGIKLVGIEPWAYAIRKIAPPNPDHPPAGLAVAKVFSDGSAIWRVTAAPSVAVAFPDRTTWDAARVVNGVRWRYMRDNAVMRAYAPAAARVHVTFLAQGINAKLIYPMRISAPDGSVHEFMIRGREAIRFTTALPKGSSRFGLMVTRPPADPLGAGAMTVETSPWTLTQAGGH